MIPVLYNENETNFNTNGIGMLHDTVVYRVREDRNGPFELELTYPAGGQWANELKDFRIISAKPNDEDDSHLFRIYEIEKNLDEQTILVYASSRTNDLGGNQVMSASVENVSAQHALNAIKNGLVEPTIYNFVSDIETLSSGEWNLKNPLACIAGSAESILSRWGGEIKRTDDTLYLYARRGTDKVTTIRQGRGLDGFKMTTSVKGMITSIVPYATYMVPESEEVVRIIGTMVDSPLVSNYPVKCIFPIDLSSHPEIFPGEENLTKEQYDAQILANINALAPTYFTYMNPGCDKPKVTLEVDLAQLSDSSVYHKFRKLEHIGLTDTVIVWVEKFDVDVEVTINSLLYNGMSEMVESFVAGNVRSSMLDDAQKRYEENLDKVKEYVDTVENGIYNSIRYTADQKNNIFSGYTEPDESLVKTNDLWYKPVADGEVEMYRWNGVWELAVTNADKIVIGSIDANLINLVNLNASNISTGTVQGANGAWNLNTGELWLGSSKEGASFYWNGVVLTIKIVEDVKSQVDTIQDDVDDYNQGILTGQTYSFNGTGFTIGGSGSDVAKHTNTESRYTHGDGSYTRIGTTGLERVVAGTPKKYHYLTHAGFISAAFSSPNFTDRGYYTSQTITLPTDFKGKDFQVIASIGAFTCYELHLGEEMKTPYYSLTMSDITSSVDKVNGKTTITARLHFARTRSTDPENPYRVEFKINYMAVG